MCIVLEVVECYNIIGMVEYMLWVEVMDLVVYKIFYMDVLGMVLYVNVIMFFVVLDLFKDECV